MSPSQQRESIVKPSTTLHNEDTVKMDSRVRGNDTSWDMPPAPFYRKLYFFAERKIFQSSPSLTRGIVA